MCGQLDESKLTFAKVRLELIECEQVGLPRQVAHLLGPILHLLLFLEIQ